ncbi:PREDICTED: CKLF-like MARVEL transmembrane domain-containing protein 2 isoform X1 [Colobus angolensis palliatus]|uniref:MARVEL domain-containing protein n=1 Tax=Colobus angolensis palliatus TaxID=336983 RepID=A0A2K5JGA8_COLAP|nr:PREDICTED: CKLF-like MARVEL transmembrane domain-containing protein 2 isoform X1 [Colobus angolensis palliatus]
MAPKAAKRAKTEPAPPPAGAKPQEDKKDDKEPSEKPQKLVQPKHEVGRRKGCRHYRWELKDSNKEFWLLGHPEIKILSLGCLIAAMILLSSLSVHPILRLIITMEISIFSFFILLYSFALHRYISFILWPISDLFNDLFACAFLVGAVVFAVRSRRSMHLHYLLAVILIGMAGVFALIDVCLQRNHFRGKRAKKHMLVAPPGKEKEPQQGKGPEPAKPPEPAKGKK